MTVALDPADEVFAALASPVRRAMLDTLSAGPLPVRALAAGFAISRPAVSQHLQVLRRANLVTEQAMGRERHYRLNPDPLRNVQAWLTHYEGFWADKLGDLRQLLDGQP